MASRYSGRPRNFSHPYAGQDFAGSHHNSHYGRWANNESKVAAVGNVALANVLAKQKSSLLGKRMFMLYFCLFIATLCSCINGYDTSIMGSINSYPQYRTYFGFDLTKGTPVTGIVFAIFTIGNLVGSFAAGPASDFKGRRFGMFLGSALTITGASVQATCVNLAGFMTGRFIVGFGVAIASAAGPAYVSEMAHPAYRGAMTGIYNTFWYMGAIPGTFIPYATSKIEGSMAWRIPLWLQLVNGGIVLCICMFLPESPRWLIANSRHDEAIDVMAKYHGNNDRNAPIVLFQYREMCEDISKTGSDKRWWDYRQLVNSPEVRYRTLVVVLTAFFCQWTGNGMVSYYYPAMLRGAGITNNTTRLFLQGFQNVVSFFGAVTGALFTDKWGRRPQLMVSTSIAAMLFVIVMVLNAINIYYDEDGTAIAKSPTIAKAEIAMIFIFGFVYSCGWTGNQAMYPVECLRYENRAKGMGMYNFFVNIAQFYNTFVTDIAFSRAGWKYYFLFIFWDVFEVIIMYFFFVETKKRTLEELSVIFKSEKPVKTSLRKTEVVLERGSWRELQPGRDFSRKKKRGA